MPAHPERTKDEKPSRDVAPSDADAAGDAAAMGKPSDDRLATEAAAGRIERESPDRSGRKPDANARDAKA
jgi:hypothetical protein